MSASMHIIRCPDCNELVLGVAWKQGMQIKSHLDADLAWLSEKNSEVFRLKKKEDFGGYDRLCKYQCSQWNPVNFMPHLDAAYQIAVSDKEGVYEKLS